MKHRTYFQAQTGYVWQWEENGAVVAIPNGPTIAYRAYLTEALHHLAQQGLPPFGSLLLAVVATNPNGAQDVRLLEALIAKALPALSPDGFLRAEIGEALALLHRLAQLPNDYQQGQKRLLLLQTLFYKAHNGLSAPRSQAYLRELAEEPAVRERVFRAEPFDASVLHRDLKTLTVASRRFPTNEFLLQAIRNLPDMTEEVPDLPPSLGPESLADALIANPQTFHVGSLIRSLWAGLTMPAPHTQPTAMPLGGVSDLTNKGPLDRLLLTEFAQDDLLFLSRLANGEALFLNRERPPASPQAERVFLIDVSLKTWGTPRTLAFALLVALAHHPRRPTPSRAFAVGDRAMPLAFDTPAALLDSLLKLSPTLHPATGLTAFSDENTLPPQTELVLITTPDALQQPDLQYWLTKQQAALSYLLTTQADGTIVVYKQHRHRRQHLQTLTLPLTRLWQRPDAPTPPANETGTLTAGPINPAYPILFPYAGQPHELLSFGNGALLWFSPERSLLMHRRKADHPYRQGWELLAEKLPVKSPYRAATTLTNGAVVVLQFCPQRRQLSLLNLLTRQQHVVPFPDWKPHPRYPQFIPDSGLFYCLSPADHYWTIRATDGHVTRHNGAPDASYLEAWADSVKRTAEQAALLPRQTVLKRVNRVGLNNEGTLTINGHQLYYSGEHIQFREWPLVGAASWRVMAVQQSARTEFQFPDGSTVRVQREGMLALRSSFPSLPTIYVPLVMNEPLGLVAGAVFAGNPYFQQPEQTHQQPTQTPGLFWQTYLVAFIETILAYDAASR